MFKKAVFLIALTGSCLQAQEGDKKDTPGEVQESRVPKEKIPPSPVLTIEQSLKCFKVQSGFRVEAVADDTLVHDPVAMAFDADGRIWVAEMSGYMQTYDGKGEDQPVGNVVVLEDANGDGKMDKRTIFLDKLVMPRAISVVRGGVLIAEPPNLWFCQDTNGDLKCDTKVAVATDYGDRKNPEHTANGLFWALDNYIYSADTTIRFKSLPNGEWKRDTTLFRGQWGIGQDDFGRLVYNSNSDQFRMDIIPHHYLIRNPNYKEAKGANVDPIRNQATFPIRVTPGVNRGYREGVLRADGTLTTFTAACAPLIYRGDNFPSEFYGNAFVCEPSANLIKRNVLLEKNGEITGWQAYTNAEFLASTDERFRPVNLNNGPDGALYIVDLYRGVIQHKIFLTSYLRKQSESRGLDQPIGMGRIYRVVHEGKKLAKVPRLGGAKTADLIQQLSNPNGAIRETAQRLLVEGNDTNAVSELRSTAVKGVESLARLHALWTLEGMNQLSAEFIIQVLNDPEPKVKAVAIRLSESILKAGSNDQLLTAILRQVNTTNAEVRLQLALSFGEIPDVASEVGMVILARSAGDSVYLRDALVSGLHKRELTFLEKVGREKMWEREQPGNESFVAALAQCVIAERKPENVDRLLAIAASLSDWRQAAILKGIAATAPKGKAQANFKPIVFSTEPAAWKKLSEDAGKETGELVKKIDPLIVWTGKAGYTAAVAAKPLSAEEQKRFEAGKELFTMTCATCHQATGTGMEGLAPPLLNSDWVLGSDDRLGRIILHGVKGPITVNGKKWEMEMPGLPFFDDEQIAAIMTYAKREWEHTGKPVTPEMIKKIRETSGERSEAWTEAELLKLK